MLQVTWLFTLKKGFKLNFRAGKLFPLLLLKGHQHQCPRQLKSFNVKAKEHINSSTAQSGACECSFLLQQCPALEFFYTKSKAPHLLL